MGFASYERQEFQQAQAYLQRSVKIIQQLPEASRSTNSYYVLGRVQRILGQYATAKMNLASALDADEQGLLREPSSAAADSVLSDLLEMASISRSQGNRAEAEEFLTRAQTATEKTPTKSMAHLARLEHERGMSALASGKSKLAEELLRDSIKRAEQDPDMDPILLSEFLDDHALALRKRGKDKEAAPEEQHAKQIRDALRNAK
jgi:tetratricopeptide (TPR) repeat protein